MGRANNAGAGLDTDAGANTLSSSSVYVIIIITRYGTTTPHLLLVNNCSLSPNYNKLKQIKK